jgi:serine/threonine-protein kinase
VPNVVGKSKDDATQTLQGQGFQVSVQYETSDKPAGQVIRQDPGGDTTATQNSMVTIVVSQQSSPTPSPSNSASSSPSPSPSPTPSWPIPTPGGDGG